VAEVKTSENQKSGLPENQKSRLPKNRSQDFRKSDANKNYINNNDFNNTDSSNIHQSIYPVYPTVQEQQPPDGGIDRIDRIDGRNAIEIYQDIIKTNIEYDALCTSYDPERVTEILELILETMCSSRKTIRIGGDDLPAEVVKGRFVNLAKGYSEFLGIKMRLRQKKGKTVVQSRVSEKAVKRIKTEAKQKIKEIARPSKGKTEAQAILNYNAFVMGEHNYYQMATGVVVDFRVIGYQVGKTVNRLGDRVKREPKGNIGGAVVEKYGTSNMLRYIKHLPLAPISYVQTKAPMCKKRSVQKYTPEGRKEIHENLGINTVMLQTLMRQKLYGRSAEYADNRLSLYCAQYGKCAVTGEMIEALDDIHCHHKLPRHRGGKDNYQNLVIIREAVHILIHATTQPTIDRYLATLNLNKKQIAKVNKLRVEAWNLPIAA